MCEQKYSLRYKWWTFLKSPCKNDIGLKNDDDFKNEDNLKNEDNFKTEDDHKSKIS